MQHVDLNRVLHIYDMAIVIVLGRKRVVVGRLAGAFEARGLIYQGEPKAQRRQATLAW